MSKYKHLGLEERIEIYTLLKQGVSISVIASRLNRNKGTISREIDRNKQGFHKGYSPIHAQVKSETLAKIQRERAPLKKAFTYFYVKNKLKEYWSPETISGRIKIEYPNNPEYWITPESIYRYIYGKGRKLKLYEYLTVSRKKRRKRTGRKVPKQSKIPNSISIDLRPNEANQRLTVGHFETDLMEGKQRSGPVVSATVDRLSRYSILSKLPNKKANTKLNYLINDLKQFPSKYRKTITQDNGSENTKHQELKHNLKVEVYFCHAYHSWEKGSIENTIKRVRRFIPKGTDLKKISAKDIKQLQNYLNNKPMKCLNYKTPNEYLIENSIKLKTLKTIHQESVALRSRM